MKHSLTDTDSTTAAIEETSSTSTDTEQQKITKTVTGDGKEQARKIIVSTLGDQALRVVSSAIGEPCKMIKKLDARYDSKSTATRIPKMVDLMSIKYLSDRDYISKHLSLIHI